MGFVKFRLVPQRRAAHFAFSEQGKTGSKAERKLAVRQPRDRATEVGALKAKPGYLREL